MTLTAWSSEFPTSQGYIVRHLPSKTNKRTKKPQKQTKKTTNPIRQKQNHKELIPTAKMHSSVGEEYTEHSCLSIQYAWFLWNQFYYYFTISSEQESN